ncbi:MAG: aminotransferase class I/II-fold pyridoxal phosphate-dependent enzyme [Firmicutes bacterium]|nr:aminotransferase class I/II-fold pyridoxal phosphate-dependent enzyme [Bacillota bacterium]
MKHGGDILTYRHLYDGHIIDFSSNINPLGPPEGLKRVMMEGFDDITAYPDIRYRVLKGEVARYLGCKESEVMLGNGAVELIHNMVMMFDRAVVPVPCFSEYVERPEILGKEVMKVNLDHRFEIDDQALLPHIREGDLLILGNPNNPTGKRINRDKLLAIHETVKERGAFLLLDEAFYEFCSDDYDSIRLLYGSHHVCVIRAATKFFALPGLRLGYAYAPKAMVQKYNRIALPWHINTFADLAGRIIFKQEDYIAKTKAYMGTQRQYMLSALKAIDGIAVWDTDCNYILIKLLRANEEILFRFMIQKGILIRKASSFEGLDDRYVRIAIKDEKCNRYLVEWMKEWGAGSEG